MNVMALVHAKVRLLSLAKIAVVMDKFVFSKVFSQFSKPVLLVMVKVALFKDPCGGCHGRGRRKQNKKLSVKIPPGVDTGDRIRLSGEGEAGEAGAMSGDLYIQIQVTAACAI